MLREAIKQFVTDRFEKPATRFNPVRQVRFRRRAWILPSRIVLENRVLAEIRNAYEFTGFEHFMRVRRTRERRLSLVAMISPPPNVGHDFLARDCLAAMCMSADNHPIHEFLSIEPVRQEPEANHFLLKPHADLREGQQVEYDYAWSIPLNVCPIGPKLRSKQVTLESTRGVIGEAELELCFPRHMRLKGSPECRVNGDAGVYTTPKDRRTQKPQPKRPSLFFDTYTWLFPEFEGTAVVSWDG